MLKMFDVSFSAEGNLFISYFVTINYFSSQNEVVDGVGVNIWNDQL